MTMSGGGPDARRWRDRPEAAVAHVGVINLSTPSEAYSACAEMHAHEIIMGRHCCGSGRYDISNVR